MIRSLTQLSYLWRKNTHTFSFYVYNSYLQPTNTHAVCMTAQHVTSFDRELICCKQCVLMLVFNFFPPRLQEESVISKDSKWTSPKVCVLHGIVVIGSLRILCPLSFCEPPQLYVWPLLLQKKRQTQGWLFACTLKHTLKQTLIYMYACKHVKTLRIHTCNICCVTGLSVFFLCTSPPVV